MGYKLAGFDVLGGVEIDPKMMEIYRRNHGPRHSFLMPVQEFKAMPNMPDELMELDVLDGSPPCSSFSMSGSREDAWGKDKKFREGQADQRLDDLFFHFIEIAARLQSKVVVAENVKGMLLGNARGYIKEIFAAFDVAGYDCQLFLLNSQRMGVPQSRERTFFIARRKDLNMPALKLCFEEEPITIRKAIEGISIAGHKVVKLTPETTALWAMVRPGQSLSKVHPKGWRFNAYKANPDAPARTISASADAMPIHWNEPRRLAGPELVRLQSFPDDFDFNGFDVGYVCGMSVPPLMMQRVSTELARALLGVHRHSSTKA
jgi:DNA (cytosine-5)-methyltransferase 1